MSNTSIEVIPPELSKQPEPQWWKKTSGIACIVSQFALPIFLLYILRPPYLSLLNIIPFEISGTAIIAIFALFFVPICFLGALALNEFWEQYYQSSLKAWVLYLSLLQFILAPTILALLFN